MVAQHTKARDYEIIWILSPEATEDEVSQTVSRLEGIIAEKGGSVTERNVWGLRPFAYTIKGFQEGNYIHAKFSVDVDGASELNRMMHASEDIIRFLITKV